MKVFWTTIFRLVIFFLAVLYLKTFDDTMGAKFASWLSPTAVVTGTDGSVLSGIVNLQTSIDDMRTQLDLVAQKVGIDAVVSEEIAAPTEETPAETE